MRDLFDVGFDDIAPAPSPAPARPTAPPPAPPPPPSLKADCCRPAWEGGHVCRVGGGDACYSDDNGRTWFCPKHVPAGFLPADRVSK